jgi:acetyltransferase-like isoleucine patch superfamily enzyme
MKFKDTFKLISFEMNYINWEEEFGPEDLSYGYDAKQHDNPAYIAIKGVPCFLEPPDQNARLAFVKILSLFPEYLGPSIFKDKDTSVILASSRFGRCSIDAGVTIGRNCTIGFNGFGYERDTDGTVIRMHHFGSVKIATGVEIHNNVNIDRGVIGDTIIGEQTKIDSLCHVAHNVQIGKRNTIAAKCSIEGSVVIGDDNIFGSNVTVLRKVRIGNRCTIGSGAVVTKDVEDNSVMVGNPARLLRKNV